MHDYRTLADKDCFVFRRYYIPQRMNESLRLYIEKGVLSGDFLQAVIRNDLAEAIGRADDENMGNLPAYVAYFHNHAPSQCWGSEAKMMAWHKQKGLLGNRAEINRKEK
jgi:hypothetical protein